ncbi:glycosyltransferase [Catellatospora sp. KI3]|uniref:glycosyltransferase n=1 Tax=Catellatospora sp. KI3 TaxID=3041620 RepID=UPI002483142C|nr:glycosyltransferase [Catellatospora sp. KI3]MDI1460760.1 glycosyltransferase [Catellatospora sp. KI3]
MRICLIGKYPPIQGGVSARTYRLAHGLAARGHAVHVVTNAAEVEDQYRIQLRPEDRTRLGGHYGPGTVRIHQTLADHYGQWHVPWHNPYATKLAGLAIETIKEHDLECVVSWYLEPYGVAGHLAASLTGRPHVINTAGSDVGRLWHQPGMRSLYDGIFRAADVVIGVRGLPKALAEIGVPRSRMMPNDGHFVPLDEFAPDGPALEVAPASTAPTIGVFGKLGRFKGVLPLVRAIRNCLDRGVPVRLAAMVQGEAPEEEAFASLVEELDLRDHVIRIPFMPHWRVPEFLRGCDVACCLEQDFPITAHNPVIALEVMATGTAVLLSHEIAAKQPERQRLAHGYNCWIVRDTNDHEEIAECLALALAEPFRAEVGRRGRLFVEHVQAQCRFPQAFEAAIHRAVHPDASGAEAEDVVEASPSDGLPPLLAAIRRKLEQADSPPAELSDLSRVADQLLSACDEASVSCDGSLFRLDTRCPAWSDEAAAGCRPSLVPGARAELYARDPIAMLTEDPSSDATAETLVIVLPYAQPQAIKLFTLTARAAAFVIACDGTRSIADVGSRVGWDSPGPARALAEELSALGVLALNAPHPTGLAMAD